MDVCTHDACYTCMCAAGETYVMGRSARETWACAPFCVRWDTHGDRTRRRLQCVRVRVRMMRTCVLRTYGVTAMR